MTDPNHALHAALDQQSARIAELETRLRQLCDAMEERAHLLDGRSVEGRNLNAAVRSAREALSNG